MRTVTTLIRLSGRPGWSESSLGANVILLVLSRGGSYEQEEASDKEQHLCPSWIAAHAHLKDKYITLRSLFSWVRSNTKLTFPTVEYFPATRNFSFLLHYTTYNDKHNYRYQHHTAHNRTGDNPCQGGIDAAIRIIVIVIIYRGRIVVVVGIAAAIFTVFDSLVTCCAVTPSWSTCKHNEPRQANLCLQAFRHDKF